MTDRAIVAGAMPAAIVHEDATALAFPGLHRALPSHAPVLPRAYVPRIHARRLSAA
ncbi:hypothetical protein LVB77_05300 [Lysobacter sp. 5GHs7-4]|uniref:hypothetical protein n=1 Tax=Lysobacter sp. 5GHs7-4 TaxID=2904253 RepID=UPI001E4FA6EF|nr:hypothetical protein [Lysobacter sp. 5GHs7-4]UHQ24130.1 hypothetical protein LVB77_05300 [Lysobacter sp. 5GHs7-4]